MAFIPLGKVVPMPGSLLEGRLKVDAFAKTRFGRQIVHYAPHLFMIPRKTMLTRT